MPPLSPCTDPSWRLTRREQQILACLKQGLDDKSHCPATFHQYMDCKPAHTQPLPQMQGPKQPPPAVPNIPA